MSFIDIFHLKNVLELYNFNFNFNFNYKKIYLLKYFEQLYEILILYPYI
jgi:hypothetical protein